MRDPIKEKDLEDITEDLRRLFLAVKKLMKEEGRKPLTIDETAQLFSKAADNVIIKGIKREKLTYISGKLKVQLSEKKDQYILSMQAYFQKKSGEWVVKSTQSEDFPLTSLTPDSQEELMKKTSIEYEIEEPVNEIN